MSHGNLTAGRVLAITLSVLSIGACSLTPEPRTPIVVERIQASDSYERTLSATAAPDTTAAPDVTAAAADSGWWTGIGGDELDRLVSVLRQDSLVLAETRWQAEQARELALQARGGRAPLLSATAEVAESRRPGIDGSSTRSDDTMYMAGLVASFDADVFGRLRSAERSTRLNAMAAELSYRATEQREIALLAKNWVAAAMLQRRLEVARRNVESFRATYELTEQRYRAGSKNASASDVQIARQNYDTARVDIPDLTRQLETQLLAIDEQLARLPGVTAATFDGRSAPTYGVRVSLGEPARLLANRPDVAAAELRYRAALEDVGTARANLYPALTLSAALSYRGEEPGDLFDWGSHIGNLTAALIQPVFQGGRLKSQVRLEQARAEEIASAFARSTLAAVIDVETALAQLAGLEEQRERLTDAVTSARVSNDIAQTRYRQGLASILALLETQRSLNNARQNLILTEQALLNAQIDLYLSLGGNWPG